MDSVSQDTKKRPADPDFLLHLSPNLCRVNVMNKIIELDLSDAEVAAVESVLSFSLADATVELSVDYSQEDDLGWIVEIHRVTLIRGDGEYDLPDGPIWDRLYQRIEAEL